MAKPKPSPTQELLGIVWRNANDATGHSWERLNHAMRRALELAIGAGFPLTAADFRALDEFRYDRWIGESPEWCYSLAVAEGNTAAAVAFEEWRGRGPLIADGVTSAQLHAGYAHLTGDRQKERLHVGCSFRWQGERVRVTSFAADGSATACSYKPVAEEKKGAINCYGENKVRRRYRITREAIIAEREERKERTEIEKRLTAMVNANKVTAAAVMEMLGVETGAEVKAVPLKRLRKAVEKIDGLTAA